MASLPTNPPGVSTFPAAPNSFTDTATEFDAKANNFVAAQVSYVPEVNTLSSWQKTTATTTYNNAIEAFESAENAKTSQEAVVSSANFKGEWSSLSGGISTPASAYHHGAYWALLFDLIDVQASEPTSTSANWAFISGSEWVKMTSSQDVIVGSKMQVSATSGNVDLNIPAMTVDQQFTVRNNLNSTNQVRLVNSSCTIMGLGGSVSAGDNLTFPVGVTRTFVCRDNNVLEIL